MGNLIRDGERWLHNERNKLFSAVIEYVRGQGSCSIRSTPSRTVFRFVDLGGNSLREVTRDYLVDAADLKINGVLIEPQRGDYIIETLKGQKIRHDVLAPNNEPDWRWSDRYQRIYRIHTKELGQIVQE